jgi:ketosteroid isomerase-like protein
MSVVTLGSMHPKIFISVALMSSLGLTQAADPPPDPAASSDRASLTSLITQMDKKMFDAFNAHDVNLVMSMFTEDVEFYHDKDGLTNHQQTGEGFATMFGNAPDIKRTLISVTLHVYPIRDFGAIELGTHRFCHKENGKDDCGNFPFVMIWKKVGESWKSPA